MSYEYSENNRIESPHSYMYTKYGGRAFLDEYFHARYSSIERLNNDVLSASLKNDFDMANETFLNKISLITFVINRLEWCMDDAVCEKVRKWLGTIQKERVPITNYKSILGLKREINLMDINKSHNTFYTYDLDIWLSELKGKNCIPTIDILEDLIFITLDCSDSDIDTVYMVLSKFIRKYEIFKRIFDRHNGSLKKIGSNYKNISDYIYLALNLALFYTKREDLKFLNAQLKINDAICSVVNEIKDINDLILFCISLDLEVGIVKSLMDKKGVA